jgi:hypothetical protein
MTCSRRMTKPTSVPNAPSSERMQRRARAEVRVHLAGENQPARARGELPREGVLAVDARGVVGEGEEAEDRVAAARGGEGEGRRAAERVAEDSGRARRERAALRDCRHGEALLFRRVADLPLGRDEEEDSPRHDGAAEYEAALPERESVAAAAVANGDWRRDADAILPEREARRMNNKTRTGSIW